MTADQRPDGLDPELKDRILGLDLSVSTEGVQARVERRQRTIRARRRTTFSVVVSITVAAIVIGVLLVSRRSSGQSVVTGPSGTTVAGLLPPGRGGGVMAYDPATGQMLLFGGNGKYGSLDDTWTWNGKSWTQLHPLHSPPAQTNSLMGYDPRTHRLVLIGSTDEVPLSDPCTRIQGQPTNCQPASVLRGVVLSKDTWTWDGTDWTDLAIPPMPSDSQLQETSPGQNQVVTDPGTKSLLLVDDDTAKLWSWTGRGWQSIHSAHAPPTGVLLAAADPASGDVLAVTQQVSNFPQGGPSYPIETWDWNGEDWTRLHPKSQPSGFTYATEENGSVTVISGKTQWLWESGDWHKQSVSTPSLRNGDQVADDPATGQFLTFGTYEGTTMSIQTDGQWTTVLGPASPTPYPGPIGQYNCFTNSDIFVAIKRQSDGSDLITISALVGGPPPCNFDLDIAMTLADRSGHPLTVSNNPLAATDDQSIGGATGAAIMSGEYTWSNWCTSAATGLQLIVTASGPDYNKTQAPESPVPISSPPDCTNRSSPSTLETTRPLTSTPS